MPHSLPFGFNHGLPQFLFRLVFYNLSERSFAKRRLPLPITDRLLREAVMLTLLLAKSTSLYAFFKRNCHSYPLPPVPSSRFLLISFVLFHEQIQHRYVGFNIGALRKDAMQCMLNECLFLRKHRIDFTK